jgi:hypothetical protein
MDPAIATIVAAVISAMASVAVAIITTSNRASDHPTPGPDPRQPIDSPPPPERRKRHISRRVLRTIGWALVCLIYGMAAFTAIICFGATSAILNGQATPEAPSIAVVTLIAGFVFAAMAFWGQRRVAKYNLQISN